MPREPFPLQWPDGWARTPYSERTASRFVTGMSRALKELAHELDLLGAADVVITSDLPHRASGAPYGSADDNGVAVWFVLDGEERVLACDRWSRAAENVHAIALCVAAIRGIERWGVRDVVARAFQGFRALPPGPADPGKRPWWVVLAIQRQPVEDPVATMAQVRRSHRRLIAAGAHPDRGGDPSAMAEINVARDEAMRELEAELETALRVTPVSRAQADGVADRLRRAAGDTEGRTIARRVLP